MLLSIVVCTKNRSASLRRLLDSLESEVNATSKEVDILVVASGCEDDTESVAKSFIDRLPLRLIVEPASGLSRARNTALDNTRAAAILWLDDDTEVTPGLVSTYLRALKNHPDASYFAGRISPAFEGNPPRWVRYVVKEYPSTYSLLGIGKNERKLDADINEFPFGANMLVRRRALEGFHFREDLGRNQNSRCLVGGEETEFFKKLSLDGHHGIWIPDANVLHWMPPARQTFRYLAAYQYAVGVIGVRILDQKTTPFAWLLLPRYLMLIGLGRLGFIPSFWIPALTEFQRERGRVAEVKTSGRNNYRRIVK